MRPRALPAAPGDAGGHDIDPPSTGGSGTWALTMLASGLDPGNINLTVLP